MKRVAALSLVAALFLLGLVAGALGERLMSQRWEPERFHRGGPPPLRGYFLRGDLDLTAKQQEQLEAVFRQQRRKFEQLHSDMRPQVESLMEETRRQVEAILTPEQLERCRRQRDRWQRWHPHHDAFDRPPPPDRAEPPEPES